jgi:hypothetical protein
MEAFKHCPGSANLPIGERKDAIQENGVPGVKWHRRGYLPHLESSEAPQHVTFHLADSLPQSAVLRVEAEVKAHFPPISAMPSAASG